LREVRLPPNITGRLYLHSMPGRSEPFKKVCEEIASKNISRVVCLAPGDEIRKKSPEYHAALVQGVPWRLVEFPLTDYGVPDDRRAFRALAKDTASALRAGEGILIHCGAGVGRTGTLAVAVLLGLDQALSDALKIVKAAGSGPETEGQRELLEWIAASGAM
jgi:protein-tyrosine phosphatase